MDVQWIREQIDNRGISQASLAHEIGLTPVQMNKVLTGYRVLQSKEADAIRRFLGYRLPEDPRKKVAVAGRVGAGELIPLIDDFERGAGLYEVFKPETLSRSSVVAVEVSGDSMMPAFDDGDLLFYSRDYLGVSQDAIGYNCIACDMDGNVWCKRLKAGSEAGLYTLLSINPTARNLIDVNLQWASRILFHLPKDMVELA